MPNEMGSGKARKSRKSKDSIPPAFDKVVSWNSIQKKMATSNGSLVGLMVIKREGNGFRLRLWNPK